MSLFSGVLLFLLLSPGWLIFGTVPFPAGFAVAVVIAVVLRADLRVTVVGLAMLALSLPPKEPPEESRLGIRWDVSWQAYKNIILAPEAEVLKAGNDLLVSYDFDKFFSEVKQNCNLIGTEDYIGKLQLKFTGDYYGRLKIRVVGSEPKSEIVEKCISDQIVKVKWLGDKNFRWAEFSAPISVKISRKIDLESPAVKTELESFINRYKEEFVDFGFRDCLPFIPGGILPATVPIKVKYTYGGEIEDILAKHENRELNNCVVSKLKNRLVGWGKKPILAGIAVSFPVNFMPKTQD